MNTRTLFAAAAFTLAAAGSAMAQETTLEAAFPTIHSVASRSAVQADARQALARGEQHEAAQIMARDPVDGSLSRAAVRAEARQALISGEIDRLNAEAYGYDGRIGGSMAGTRHAGLAR